MNKKRILVVDDNEDHRAVARAQLETDFDLTVVDSFDEGRKALTAQFSTMELLERLPGEHVPRPETFKLIGEDQYKKVLAWRYLDVEEIVQFTDVKPPVDIALIDLVMPASRHMLNKRGESFIGQEMPLGIFLAMNALRRGVPVAAVFTDSDHHSHPASACFDLFNRREREPEPLPVCGGTLYLCNNRDWVGIFSEDDLVEPMSERVGYMLGPNYETIPNEGFVRAKNWRALLDYVLK